MQDLIDFESEQIRICAAWGLEVDDLCFPDRLLSKAEPFSPVLPVENSEYVP